MSSADCTECGAAAGEYCRVTSGPHCILDTARNAPPAMPPVTVDMEALTEQVDRAVQEISTEALLVERGKTHGDFTDHARITQTLKSVMKAEGSEKLPPIMRETLDMIAHKIGRVLAGNPNHKDHWDDIAGYAKLVSQRITE